MPDYSLEIYNISQTIGSCFALDRRCRGTVELPGDLQGSPADSLDLLCSRITSRCALHAEFLARVYYAAMCKSRYVKTPVQDFQTLAGRIKTMAAKLEPNLLTGQKACSLDPSIYDSMLYDPIAELMHVLVDISRRIEKVQLAQQNAIYETKRNGL